MGGAAGTAGLAGLLAAGQSEDSEAGPLTAAAKALLDKNFTESAVRSATDMAAAHKSREAITTMNIDEFLNLANPGFSPEKMDGLIGVDKFDEIPFLSMRNDNNGGAWITGHEGRHRARMLKAWGETEMPVRMRGNVRWDQQDSPDNFDYVEEWPSTLVSENGSVTTPFPFAQGDSNFLSSDGMALRSKYTPPKKAEPKPDSYDTEILSELLDEFNFEKGSADPRLLGGVAAGTAGLLAAPALVKDGVFQHSATSEPVVERRKAVNNQSSLLEGVTDFADDVFASFKDAAGPVGSLLMPFEGVNDYLKVVNDNDKKPTWWDRLGLLDL
jgi:hypothetical protein